MHLHFPHPTIPPAAGMEAIREEMEALDRPAPTPLDLLSLAELRHTAPELAMQLATQSGREHDALILNGERT